MRASHMGPNSPRGVLPARAAIAASSRMARVLERESMTPMTPVLPLVIRTALRASAATIARLAPRTAGWFPAGTGPSVGKTGAKAEIWAKPADFAERSKAFAAAAVAFNAAAKSTDAGAMQARFGDLAKTCKGCHETYRSEMKH